MVIGLPRCGWWGGLFCVTLAAVMQVGDNRRVYFPGTSAPLPELCMLYSRFGVDCPGCGLTRTFIYMAHGQPGQRLAYEPCGYIGVLVCMPTNSNGGQPK